MTGSELSQQLDIIKAEQGLLVPSILSGTASPSRVSVSTLQEWAHCLWTVEIGMVLNYHDGEYYLEERK